MNRSLQKCLWGEDPRHHLPQYLCDTGKQEYLTIEKYNRLPGGQGRGGCQRLQVKSSWLTPFGTEPCWIQFLKKNKQTNKKGSLTRSHHCVLLLLDRRGGEEILPPWICTSWWKWENLAVSPSVRGTVFQHRQLCYRSESERTRGPRWIGWSVWFGQRPTFL